MFDKKLKKTIYTLNLNSDVYKDITDITYPLFKIYANKIGAEFYEITERKFPEAKSPTYEKCQIFELAQEHQNDWNIFIDADAIIHPDTPDITELLKKDEVYHNAVDFSPLRFVSDRFFKRDGRNIGSASWLCIASDWCIELFKPLDDMTLNEAYDNIFPIYDEVKRGYESHRLIEDYVFSRNIAKYGLKVKTFKDLHFEGDYFWHDYAKPIEEKTILLKQVIKNWNLSDLKKYENYQR